MAASGAASESLEQGGSSARDSVGAEPPLARAPLRGLLFLKTHEIL